MERIEVGRYTEPEKVGYKGWMNPEQDKGYAVPRWILFVDTDGKVALGIRNDEKDELEFA